MRTKLAGVIAIVAALTGVVTGSLVYSGAISIPGVSVGSSGHKVWDSPKGFMSVSAWQSRNDQLTVEITLRVSNATEIQCNPVPSGSYCGNWIVQSRGQYLTAQTYTQVQTYNPVPTQIQFSVGTYSSDPTNSTRLVQSWDYVTVNVEMG